MTVNVNRRFYKEASVIGSPAAWQIALDGKVLKTPARRDLKLSTRALADAIRDEWTAQDSQVRPHTMPLTQMINTAIDRVGFERERIAAEAAGYAETDLVCYRADQPSELAVRQSEHWDPLVEWIRQRYDATLKATTGIIAVQQPEAGLAILRRAVEGQDDLHLTALAALTGATGSLVIGLAVLEGRLDPEQAVAAAQLDELFQAERWGSDPDAERRRATQREDILVGRRFVELVEAGEN